MSVIGRFFNWLRKAEEQPTGEVVSLARPYPLTSSSTTATVQRTDVDSEPAKPADPPAAAGVTSEPPSSPGPKPAPAKAGIPAGKQRRRPQTAAQKKAAAKKPARKKPSSEG